MADGIQTSVLTLDGVASLAAAVPKPDFGKAVLDHISSHAAISNFGAFYIADLAHPKPTLSVWSGKVSDYWFRPGESRLKFDCGLELDS